MVAYTFLTMDLPELRSKYSQYEKIQDYDNLINEIIQVYFTRLLAYMVMNFNSKTELNRMLAINCARICLAMAKQYLDTQKNFYK